MRALGVVVALVSLGGCRLLVHSPDYSVEVKNEADNTLETVEVKYANERWKHEFGYIGAKSAKSCSVDTPLPTKTATVSWARSDGLMVERTFEMPKLEAAELDGNVLQFTIKKDESVEVRIVKLPKRL